MHSKPKSAKATVGKREANREGNVLPGKMNQTLANLQQWRDGWREERHKRGVVWRMRDDRRGVRKGKRRLSKWVIIIGSSGNESCDTVLRKRTIRN